MYNEITAYKRGEPISRLFYFFFIKMEITRNLVGEFLQFYVNKNHAYTTIYHHKHNFEEFVEWLKVEKESWAVMVEDITLRVIEQYKTHLHTLHPPKTSRHYGVSTYLAPSTIQGKIQTIKMFIKFLNLMYDQGLTYYKIESPKVKYPMIEYLDKEEIQELIQYVRNIEIYGINRFRSELLITLAFTS
jgi:site-specific recombinase XerD